MTCHMRTATLERSIGKSELRLEEGREVRKHISRKKVDTQEEHVCSKSWELE
jgi:hypothetical protein